MLAFHCAGIEYHFAYSYNDLIEFVRVRILSSVAGCSALSPVVLLLSSACLLLRSRAWGV